MKSFLSNNPKSVLLDVRTEEEWNADGKPDGEKIALKTPVSYTHLTLPTSDLV